MNALDKLREYTLCEEGDRYTKYEPSDRMADEIESEIAESYLPLPVDRNGEVLRIGDEVWFHDEPDADPNIVRGYGMTNGRDVDVYINRADEGWCPNTVTVPDVLVHRKPDQLKELISEAALEIIDVGYQNVPSIGNVPKISVDEGRLDEWLEVNAEHIRVLTGGAR